MLCMLLAYDADGNVIATLDHMVAKDKEGNAVGLVDFESHEKAGGELTDVWEVDGAKGSKTWPEWLGARAHEFKVELDGPAGKKRIATLVHANSGHRRERSGVEAAIEGRIAAAIGPADIRDLVGGPDRPIPLDEHGRDKERVKVRPSRLPVVLTGGAPQP